MEHTPQHVENTAEHSSPFERIAQAALRLKEQLFTGAHHDEALHKLEQVYPDWEETYSDEIEYGFTTNTGRFVDRKEANQIAERAEQLLHPTNERQGRAADELDSYNVDLGEKPEQLH